MDASLAGGGFFYFFRCNSLKKLESAKEIQENASNFPWFYLNLFSRRAPFGDGFGLRWDGGSVKSRRAPEQRATA
jgi:hypothetical protein